MSKTYFADVDEFLLLLYYVYNKSPKKCQELEDVVSELKECLSHCEFPGYGGVRPLRACGFIAHKVWAVIIMGTGTGQGNFGTVYKGKEKRRTEVTSASPMSYPSIANVFK